MTRSTTAPRTSGDSIPSSSTGFHDRANAGVRVSHVESVEELGLDERTRVSPWVTLYTSDARNAHFRLQYNYDDLHDGDAHSVWAQLKYSFGGKEVR